MAPKRKVQDNGDGAGTKAMPSPVNIQLLGCRVPYEFFLTAGFGEADAGGGVDPWETGSYDIALEDAGIQDFNVVPYTSVIPPEGKEISFEEARPRFHHGAVLETIIAEMNGCQGDRISAGVGRCKIQRKRDGKMIGGYAAEYKGHAQEQTVKEILREDLKGIFDRRFDVDEYEMMEESYSIRVGEVTKSYGTVIACICFLSSIMPILEIPQGLEEKMKQHEHNVADTAKEEGGPTRRIKFF